MKRIVTLSLVLIFLLSLFAGCGSGGGTVTSTPTPTSAATSPGGTEPAQAPESTQAPTTPTPESSPYHYAVGNYAVDERGYPTERYDYTLPLTTNGEVFSFWTSTFVNQYISEDGMGSMPYQKGAAEMTGVNIEYQVVSWDTRSMNFSVMLAADDLPDIMACGVDMYPGTPYEAVEEGYFVNIYDYKDYCPNYIYQAVYDPDDTSTYHSVFYDDELILAFYCMSETAFYATNKVIRNDYLEKVGLSVDELVTWDDWFDAMTRIKVEIDDVTFPWPLTASIDVKGSYSTSPSFDTLGYVNSSGLPDIYVKDGVVTFGNTTERDRDYMAKLNEFYEAGLIDPDWGGYASSASFADKIQTGQIAIMDMAATEINGYNTNSDDPDCDWQGLSRPLLYEGQTLHVGGDLVRVAGGSSSISAKCSNIALAVTWCDWRYSPEGAHYNAYGPEGYIWNYDSEGRMRATDWALNNEMGFAWVCTLYALNNVFEHGLEDPARKTIYDGGEIILETRQKWMDYDYDGAYEFPHGIRLSAEDTDIVNSYAADIQTYIAENYVQFLNGTKSFDEWDSYVAAIYAMGMQEIVDIYQAAYDAFLAKEA